MSFWPQLMAIAERLDGLSYYDVLGVAADAPAERIMERYYELAGRLHPDRHARGATVDQLAALNRVLARIAEARKVLTAPSQRAIYDEKLKQGVSRLESDDGKKRPSGQKDPKHPTARQLFEQAQKMVAGNDLARARTTLGLARQYEPDSPAINEAIAAIAPRPRPAPVAPVTSPNPEPGPAPIASPSPTPSPGRSPSPTASPTPSPGRSPSPTASPTPSARPTPRPTARPTSGLDARRDPRREIALPAKVRLNSWDKVEKLITRDLSRGGMFLRSTNAMPVGALVEVTIETPVGEGVRLMAEVVHIVPPGGDSPPGVGLRFQGDPVEALVALDQLITRHRT